jgi:hypothetical protein
VVIAAVACLCISALAGVAHSFFAPCCVQADIDSLGGSGLLDDCYSSAHKAMIAVQSIIM